MVYQKKTLLILYKFFRPWMELCNSLQKQQQEKIFTEAWLGQWPSIREYKFTHKLCTIRENLSRKPWTTGARLQPGYALGWSDFSFLWFSKINTLKEYSISSIPKKPANFKRKFGQIKYVTFYLRPPQWDYLFLTWSKEKPLFEFLFIFRLQRIHSPCRRHPKHFRVTVKSFWVKKQSSI